MGSRDGHVANVVGGVRQDNLYYGDADKRFSPNDADYQRSAVRFLLDNALTTPTPFIDSDIVMRLTGSGVANTVLGSQRRILNSLVRSDRINRMAEHTEGNSGDYSPAEFMNDIREGVFSELAASQTQICTPKPTACVRRTSGSLPLRSRAAAPTCLRWRDCSLANSAPLSKGVNGGSDVMQAHAADLLARMKPPSKLKVAESPPTPSLAGSLRKPTYTWIAGMTTRRLWRSTKRS